MLLAFFFFLKDCPSPSSCTPSLPATTTPSWGRSSQLPVAVYPQDSGRKTDPVLMTDSATGTALALTSLTLIFQTLSEAALVYLFSFLGQATHYIALLGLELTITTSLRHRMRLLVRIMGLHHCVWPCIHVQPESASDILGPLGIPSPRKEASRALSSSTFHVHLAS